MVLLQYTDTLSEKASKLVLAAPRFVKRGRIASNGSTCVDDSHVPYAVDVKTVCYVHR